MGAFASSLPNVSHSGEKKKQLVRIISEKYMHNSLQLPDEILFRIITFLDLQTLFRVSQVCKTWRRLSEDPMLWQQICKKYLSPSEYSMQLMGDSNKNNDIQENQIDWKVIYVKKMVRLNLAMNNIAHDGRAIDAVFLGDTLVGKSCLVEQYVLGGYKDDIAQTVATTAFQVSITSIKGKKVHLLLRDTAGDECYDRLRRFYHKWYSAHVWVLMFSVTGRASYENILLKWIYEVREFARAGARIVLVANKIDAANRTVSSYACKKLARKIGATECVECSVKTREGLEEVLAAIVRASC